jgi:thiol-disulfide isomerase/thioredoxin
MKWIILFLVSALLPGCSIRDGSIKTGLEGKPLPSLNLLLMDNATHLNMNTIPVGKPIVLVLFSPECPYCRAQTDAIIEDMPSLKNIQFYFLSSFPLESIKDYVEEYQLKKYANITVAQDDGRAAGKYFKAPGVPYIAVYDKDKRLKKAWIGKADIYDLKSAAFE